MLVASSRTWQLISHMIRLTPASPSDSPVVLAMMSSLRAQGGVPGRKVNREAQSSTELSSLLPASIETPSTSGGSSGRIGYLDDSFGRGATFDMPSGLIKKPDGSMIELLAADLFRDEDDDVDYPGKGKGKGKRKATMMPSRILERLVGPRPHVSTLDEVPDFSFLRNYIDDDSSESFDTIMNWRLSALGLGDVDQLYLGSPEKLKEALLNVIKSSTTYHSTHINSMLDAPVGEYEGPVQGHLLPALLTNNAAEYAIGCHSFLSLLEEGYPQSSFVDKPGRLSLGAIEVLAARLYYLITGAFRSLYNRLREAVRLLEDEHPVIDDIQRALKEIVCWSNHIAEVRDAFTWVDGVAKQRHDEFWATYAHEKQQRGFFGRLRWKPKEGELNTDIDFMKRELKRLSTTVRPESLFGDELASSLAHSIRFFRVDEEDICNIMTWLQKDDFRCLEGIRRLEDRARLRTWFEKANEGLPLYELYGIKDHGIPVEEHVNLLCSKWFEYLAKRVGFAAEAIFGVRDVDQVKNQDVTVEDETTL